MSDEFDTVAAWTADAAEELGRDHYLPAGCRGSGGPAVLSWLVDRLHLSPADRMLDCGAGVGGPAAFAHEHAGVRPVLIEPEPGACRAAARLFDLPVARADAQRLPFPDSTFDAAWCLAVLCTVGDQPALLGELCRVLAPRGRLGLLVYTSRGRDSSRWPEGNDFPTEAGLTALLSEAGLEITERRDVDNFPKDDDDWRRRSAAVDDLMATAHAEDSSWRTAQKQSEAFGRLLADGEVRGAALILRPAGTRGAATPAT